MRTWVRQDEANSLYQHLGKVNPHETLVAEVVPVDGEEEGAMVPAGETAADSDEELRKYSKLRLLRERVEVLDLLQRTAVELPSQDICSLLDLKRLPNLERLSDGEEGFQRMGLEFLRFRRNGQRTAWKVRKAQRH